MGRPGAVYGRAVSGTRERDGEQPTGAGPQAAAPAAEGEALTLPVAWLDLQRAVGNRALQRALSAAAGSGVIQRQNHPPGMTSGQGASAVAPGPQASIPSPEQTAGRARIDAALKEFTQGNFKDIQETDWPLARPEEKIRLLEKATDPSWVLVETGDELAIEACWRSFDGGFQAAVESHPIIWERSVDRGADPSAFPRRRGSSRRSRGSRSTSAKQNLDRNEDAIVTEMKGWGLTPPKHLLSDPSKGGDAKAPPAGPLPQEVIKRLEEQNKLARIVWRHERNLKELQKRRVGKNAEPFDPGRPPGEDWEFAGKTTYAWVKEAWDRASAEISLILNAYPALYAAHGRDELEKFAFPEPDKMHKGGEFSFVGSESLAETQKQLERSLEGVKKTRETLSSEDDAYLDLTPVHRAIYGGRALSASGEKFTRALMQPIVFDERQMKQDIEAAERFGIDAALFILVVAGTIGTLGGAAIAVGIAGARALGAQGRADDLAAAHGAAVSDDATLVTKAAVTAAEAEAQAAKIDLLMTAVMEVQGLAIHALTPGAKAAAGAATDPKSVEQKLAQAAAAEEGGEAGSLRQKLRARTGEPGEAAAPRSVVDPNATVPIAGGRMKSWEGVPHHQRPTELAKVANQTLVANGVPPVDIVISPGKGCKFDFKTWTIQVPERYFADAISHSEFLDMYASAMHEAEHAMDIYNVARLKAPEHGSAGSLAEALGMGGPRAREAAERAFKNPMAANDPLRGRAGQIHESMYGANKGPRNTLLKDLDAAKERVRPRGHRVHGQDRRPEQAPGGGDPGPEGAGRLRGGDRRRSPRQGARATTRQVTRSTARSPRSSGPLRPRTGVASGPAPGSASGRSTGRRSGSTTGAAASRRRRRSGPGSRATSAPQSGLDEYDIQIAVSQEKVTKARSDLAQALLQ